MYWLGTSRRCPGPLCEFHSINVCLLLAFTPFLLLLRCLVLLCVLVCIYPLWREGCMGFWAHVYFLLSIPRLGIVQAKAFVSIACWAHVLSLFFMVVGHLAINLSILLHCVCCGLCLAFTSYYSRGLASWYSYCISPLILSFGLPRSIYYIFTSYHSYGLVGHHSCHANPLSLPLYSLGFLSPFTFFLPPFTPMGLLPDSLGFLSPFTTFLPLITLMGLLAFILAMSAQLRLSLYSLCFFGLFTSSLPLVTFIGLLAINPTTSAHWACYLFFFTILPLIFFSSPLLLGFFCCWVFCQK